jgi:hypothetical protein
MLQRLQQLAGPLLLIAGAMVAGGVQHYGTQREPLWEPQLIAQGWSRKVYGVSFLAPPSFVRDTRFKPIDTDVAQFESDHFGLAIRVGDLKSSFEDQDDVVGNPGVEHLKIAGRKAFIVTTPTGRHDNCPYDFALFLRGADHKPDVIMSGCGDESGLAEAHRLFQSIKD